MKKLTTLVIALVASVTLTFAQTVNLVSHTSQPIYLECEEWVIGEPKETTFFITMSLHNIKVSDKDNKLFLDTGINLINRTQTEQGVIYTFIESNGKDGIIQLYDLMNGRALLSVTSVNSGKGILLTTSYVQINTTKQIRSE